MTIRRYSEWSVEELEGELQRLQEEIRLAETEAKAEVLKQKYYMAKSYLLKEHTFPEGIYRVEGRDELFEVQRINGIMAWGKWENGEEGAVPISTLQPKAEASFSKPIRIETNEQLQEAFRIRLEVFVDEQKVPADLEMDEYDVSPQAAHHVLLMDNEGIPAATGRFIEYKPDTAKMQRVAVRKKERGRGTGRALMVALEQWAKEEGYTYSLLDAQCQAEPFYLKLGYETVSPETFLDAGIPHVRMKKQLR